MGGGQDEREGKSGGGEEGITLDKSPPPSRTGAQRTCGFWGWEMGPWGLEGGPGDPHSPTGSLLTALEMSDREGGEHVCRWKAEGKISPHELNGAMGWPSPSLHYRHVVPVQSLSHSQLFATPWTAARQASLSFAISQGLLTLMFIESAMPSNRLIMDHPIDRWVRVETESVTRGQGKVEVVNCVGKTAARGVGLDGGLEKGCQAPSSEL